MPSFYSTSETHDTPARSVGYEITCQEILYRAQQVVSADGDHVAQDLTSVGRVMDWVGSRCSSIEPLREGEREGERKENQRTSRPELLFLRRMVASNSSRSRISMHLPTQSSCLYLSSSRLSSSRRFLRRYTSTPWRCEKRYPVRRTWKGEAWLRLFGCLAERPAQMYLQTAKRAPYPCGAFV